MSAPKGNKVTFIVIALVLAAAGGGYWFFNGRQTADAEASKKPLPVEPAGRRSLQVQVEASGTLEPLRWVEVKSKASGEIRRVLVETGDRVDAGSLLAEIDPRDVENAYQQAAADVEAARVRAQTTAAQKARLEQLKTSGVVTQQELEAAVESHATARATLVRSETNLQLARERRGDVTIRAPASGTIVERTAEVGSIIASATSNISGGTTMFKMADLTTMRVRTKVDETDIGQVEAGQPATVTVEAFPGRTFRGTVQKIEPQSVVEQNVTMFPVLIKLANEGGLLKPGMNAEVAIEVARREDVLTVPAGSVVTFRDATAVAKVLGVNEDSVTALVRPALPDGGTVSRAECASLEGKADGGAAVDGELLARCRAMVDRRSQGGGGGRSRPALVFVKTPTGPEPRRVVLGLSNWDYAEVKEGLEEGAEVVQVAAAQVEKSKADMAARMKQFNQLPGTGGTQRGGAGGGRTR